MTHPVTIYCRVPSVGIATTAYKEILTGTYFRKEGALATVTITWFGYMSDGWTSSCERSI